MSILETLCAKPIHEVVGVEACPHCDRPLVRVLEFPRVWCAGVETRRAYLHKTGACIAALVWKLRGEN